jgi:hypothetical protein
MFLLDLLPFELTFDILFRHGGFDGMESVLGRHACWEFTKLMCDRGRADLLCVCRAVQLLDHPAHALFLLNYPPDSSIPENIRAWRVAQRCSIGWELDTRSVVHAMRAFISTRQHAQQVFPWLNTADLTQLRSEEEWRALGRLQRLSYKFNEWWWNGQREAFHLERGAAGSDMGVVIRSTAKAEMDKLAGALKRRELGKIRQGKERSAWVRMKRSEADAQIAANNRGGSSQQQGAPKPAAEDKKRAAGSAALGPAAQASEDKKRAADSAALKPVVLTSEDKKRADSAAKARLETLLSVLKSVERALQKPRAMRFERIARLVAAIERLHPLIKWNLRLHLHSASERNVWDVELLLKRFRWVEVANPVEQLACSR